MPNHLIHKVTKEGDSVLIRFRIASIYGDREKEKRRIYFNKN